MHRIKGIVSKGKQKGRILGFPTANLRVKQKIDSGVYVGEVILDEKKHKAAIFVPQEENFIEAHILNFSKDIYGRTIEILIGKKIREVQRLQDDKELKEQIKKDIKMIN